ncbi:MAG: indole-3-glycerol phosphate synthase TrpC [Gemmatimonadota bacterium]|nr:indole-3-glycerol phosphate synthase TrpC [Gemmatimonadota bacterium]
MQAQRSRADASPTEFGGDSLRRPGILDRIVAGKRGEVERLGAQRRDLARAADDVPPPRPVLEQWRERRKVAVIAEVKRRSPGAGAIDPGLDPLSLSAKYESGGACAISVLTDAAWFGGSLDDLRAVREARAVPVLRKDFVIDEVQVTEARAAGADLVLLIVRILEPALLGDLRAMVHDLGMTALVEVHDEWEVDAALEAGAGLVGVNNRDLTVFETDLAVTERLARYVPGDVMLVSESGIRDRDDVARVAAAGADAVLVGEALVRSGSPAGLVGEMAAVGRVGRR